MGGFEYRTRGGKSPQGLQKVYFTSADKDFDLYFEEYAKRILDTADCSVWFKSQPGEYEDMEVDLKEMSLFVIPVTTELFREKGRALLVDLPFAEKKHIPVLPVMMESGLDELYAKYFGDRHHLDPNLRDDTAISFDDKFNNYILSVTVGDELAEKVRQAFDAYIFLSYRKKDRAYAQELMRLIHGNDFCRDIAIWYDEFLVPGEGFNEAIGDALKKSRLFALVVTPNLVNEENYVHTVEYPMAKKAEKPILPAEMADTDGNKLASQYDGIGSAVPRDRLPAELERLLADIAKRENDNDPEHNFFIGLAYLGGIDVEKDYERALKLITFAADHGVEEAIKKLVDMYESGEGVERNYRAAIEWQKKLVGYYKKKLENKGFFDPRTNGGLSAYQIFISSDYLIELQVLGGKLMDVGDPEAAEQCYRTVYEMYFEREAAFSGYEDDVSSSLKKLGDVRLAQGDFRGAEKYYARSLEIRERLAEETNTVEARSDLSKILVSLGKIRDEQGKLEGSDSAEEYYTRSLEIAERLAEEANTVEAWNNLSLILDGLGDIKKELRDFSGAEEYYTRSLEIRERLAEETGTVEAAIDLSVSLITLGDIKKEQRDFLGAEAYYTRSLEINERLAKETGKVIAAHNLSVALTRLGDIKKEQRDFRGAEEYYTRSLEIDERLAEETDKVNARHGLLISLWRLGDIRRMQRNIPGAEEYYTRSLEIAERFAEETNTFTARDDLSTSLSKLGVIGIARCDFDVAEKYFTRSLDIIEKLAEETKKADSQSVLSDMFLRLGILMLVNHNCENAAKNFCKAISIKKPLVMTRRTPDDYYELIVIHIMAARAKRPNDKKLILEAKNLFFEAKTHYPKQEMFFVFWPTKMLVFLAIDLLKSIFGKRLLLLSSVCKP